MEGILVIPAVLVVGGLITAVALRNQETTEAPSSGIPLIHLGISRPVGAILLVLFFGLLGGMVLVRALLDWEPIQLFESFYRMGSLIFGGGQVVLPMMLTEVVDSGWVTEEEFLDGFALMLALPGPMFAFSAYLGGVVGGIKGALIALAGRFLPGVLIIYAVLPFWERVRRQSLVRSALVGVNATAIGLVVAAVFMLWARTAPTTSGSAIALLAFGGVAFFRVPAPAVIVGAGALGWLFTLGGV